MKITNDNKLKIDIFKYKIDELKKEKYERLKLFNNLHLKYIKIQRNIEDVIINDDNIKQLNNELFILMRSIDIENNLNLVLENNLNLVLENNNDDLRDDLLDQLLNNLQSSVLLPVKYIINSLDFIDCSKISNEELKKKLNLVIKNNNLIQNIKPTNALIEKSHKTLINKLIKKYNLLLAMSSNNYRIKIKQVNTNGHNLLKSINNDETKRIEKIQEREEIEISKHIKEYDLSISSIILNNHNIPMPVVVYKPPYNSLRRSKIFLLFNIFTNYNKFNLLNWSKKCNLILDIERACLNYSVDFSQDTNILTSWDNKLFNQIYTNTFYKVGVNLDNSLIKNNNLVDRLFNGDIKIIDLPKMTFVEMFPKKYEDILKQLEISKKVKKSLKTTTMYKCGKCYKNKCTIEQLYNRSLDEGVNLRITCINCNHQFNA